MTAAAGEEDSRHMVQDICLYPDITQLHIGLFLLKAKLTGISRNWALLFLAKRIFFSFLFAFIPVFDGLTFSIL